MTKAAFRKTAGSASMLLCIVASTGCVSGARATSIVVAGPTQRETYTKAGFKNAPESVDRVLSVQHLAGGQMLLTVAVGACIPSRTAANGKIIASRFDVPNGQAAAFRAGEYVLTGAIQSHDRYVQVIRRLTQAEAKACMSGNPGAFVNAS